MNAPVRHTEADIWARIIHPQGEISKQTAREILKLEFPPEDQQRMKELAARNRRGELTEEAEAQLDHFCRVGTLLGILKLRSKRVLQPNSRNS